MAIATGQQATAADALALATKTKLLSHTREGDAAAGDVSYTGYGFLPKALIIFAQGAGERSWGFGDQNLAEMCIYSGAADGASTTAIIYLYQAAGDYQTAVLKTLDADGFTLTWSAAGNPGNLTLVVLALY